MAQSLQLRWHNCKDRAARYNYNLSGSAYDVKSYEKLL